MLVNPKSRPSEDAIIITENEAWTVFYFGEVILSLIMIINMVDTIGHHLI